MAASTDGKRMKVNMFSDNLAHIFIAERSLLSRETRRPEQKMLLIFCSG